VRDARERITRLIEDTLGVEVSSPDVDLIEDGLLDSLALISLLTEIEREFGFELPLDTLEVDDFRTVASAAAYVETTFAAGGTAA
jgi:D-alanine--poly(phosphoribitol) ligase subunit 2